MNYYEVTWVLTKRKYSIFNWDFGKCMNTIAYSENCLPELEIQSGFINLLYFARGWYQYQDIPL